MPTPSAPAFYPWKSSSMPDDPEFTPLPTSPGNNPPYPTGNETSYPTSTGNNPPYPTGNDTSLPPLPGNNPPYPTRNETSQPTSPGNNPSYPTGTNAPYPTGNSYVPLLTPYSPSSVFADIANDGNVPTSVPYPVAPQENAKL